MKNNRIVILGIFVVDIAYRASRLPRMGETLLGASVSLGPGGKGSNQAVGCARLGSSVQFLSRLGDDRFGQMARELWHREGIEPLVVYDGSSSTGSAFIFVEQGTGDNAIIVVPGAAGEVGGADIELNAKAIRESAIFMTQFEVEEEAFRAGLETARSAGVVTILNPAPAREVELSLISLCDFVIPNESEASELTGIDVRSVGSAFKAAREMRRMGAGTAIVTLGENGSVLETQDHSAHVPAFHAGKVVETTGAGDSYCSGFASALLSGQSPVEAARYASAAAAISVTRKGTAPSMPTAGEVSNLLARLT